MPAEAKNCSRCGESKPLPEFFRNKGALDGRASHCKQCAKAAKRKSGPSEAERERKRRYRKENREKVAAYRDRWAARYPERRKAQAAVNYALKTGRMEPRPDSCEECQEAKRVQAHHDDYSKPLEVRWLCSPCHQRWHSENPDPKGGQE